MKRYCYIIKTKDHEDRWWYVSDIRPNFSLNVDKDEAYVFDNKNFAISFIEDLADDFSFSCYKFELEELEWIQRSK